MKTMYKYIALFLLSCVFYLPKSIGQLHYGAIEYEIKINMDKRFPPNNQNMGRMGGRGRNVNSNSNNYLIQTAMLYFNDTMSVFVMDEPDNMRDLNRTFITSTQTLLNSERLETHINLFGEDFMIQDKLPERVWKFTNKERLIAGKMAQQAVTKANDSTTIYAWFDTDFFPSIGPESYRDLPGAILGLAYEDGSITYFATKIDDTFPNLLDKFPSVKTKRVYDRTSFNKEFSTKYDASHHYYQLIKDLLSFF